MTRYFCDRCNKEIAREHEIESATFTLECGAVFGEPTRIQVHKELCSECSYKAIQMFKELINNI